VKLLTFLTILVFTCSQVFAERPWTQTEGTVPTDDVYYIDTDLSLTGTLIIPEDAHLEIRNNATVITNGCTIIGCIMIIQGDMIEDDLFQIPPQPDIHPIEEDTSLSLAMKLKLFWLLPYAEKKRLLIETIYNHKKALIIGGSITLGALAVIFWKRTYPST
jgi:hypothetical protein